MHLYGRFYCNVCFLKLEEAKLPEGLPSRWRKNKVDWVLASFHSPRREPMCGMQCIRHLSKTDIRQKLMFLFRFQMDIWKPLPYVIFGMLATLAGFLALFLPETHNQKLCDTVAEAETFIG